MPLYVRFGDETFRDYVDLSPAEFYERLRDAARAAHDLAAVPGRLRAVYDELAGYERIISLHLSGRLSGTVESARTAAADYPDGARDRLRHGVGRDRDARARRSSALLDAGTTDEAVDAYVDRFKREAGLLFTVDTLEFLARGGRIGRARAAGRHSCCR